MACDGEVRRRTAPVAAAYLIFSSNMMGHCIALDCIHTTWPLVTVDPTRRPSFPQEAVERAARRPYGLIFMDVQMPRLNGLDAARRILARRPARTPPPPPQLPPVDEAAFSDGTPAALAVKQANVTDERVSSTEPSAELPPPEPPLPPALPPPLSPPPPLPAPSPSGEQGTPGLESRAESAAAEEAEAAEAVANHEGKRDESPAEGVGGGAHPCVFAV